jgi:DNA-binding LytR/AlgR family response regulator
LYDLKAVKDQTPAQPAVNYLFLNADYSQVKVMFDDITWIEGLRDYVKINLKSSKNPLVIRSSLKAIEAELPQHKFIRIHKSYLVAIADITAVRKNSIFIKEMELPIGETFREDVEKLVRREM